MFSHWASQRMNISNKELILSCMLEFGLRSQHESVTYSIRQKSTSPSLDVCVHEHGSVPHFTTLVCIGNKFQAKIESATCQNVKTRWICTSLPVLRKRYNEVFDKTLSIYISLSVGMSSCLLRCGGKCLSRNKQMKQLTQNQKSRSIDLIIYLIAPQLPSLSHPMQCLQIRNIIQFSLLCERLRKSRHFPCYNSKLFCIFGLS